MSASSAGVASHPLMTAARKSLSTGNSRASATNIARTQNRHAAAAAQASGSDAWWMAVMNSGTRPTMAAYRACTSERA